MVIAAAGHSGTRSATDNTRTTMQAFPTTDDAHTWPRLLGRALFIFFGGNKPAICDLHVDASFDDLTADIKESWAGCLWAIQASLDSARKHSGNANLVTSLQSLAQRIYAITNLQNTELAGLEITGVIRAMNERYGKRLGLDPSAIEKAHLNEAAKSAPAH
jgi:hypothetical protein